MSEIPIFRQLRQQLINRASDSWNARMISVSMKRYAPNLISAALLIAAVLMYLHQEESWTVALSCAIAAFVILARTLILRWYRAKAQK